MPTNKPLQSPKAQQGNVDRNGSLKELARLKMERTFKAQSRIRDFELSILTLNF